MTLLTEKTVRGATVAASVRDETLIVEPFSGGDLVVGRIPARSELVVRAFERVDLRESGLASFLIEHAAAACSVCGVTSAEIRSLVTSFDFNRPSHVAASEAGFTPSDTYGSADGRIWTGPSEWSLQAMPATFLAVTKDVMISLDVTDDSGSVHRTSILLSPVIGDSINVRCSAAGFVVSAELALGVGVLDSALRASILSAQSIATKPGYSWDEEAVIHAVGDTIGDVLGVGRILASLDVELGYYYHAATHSVRPRLLRGDVDNP